MSRSTNKDFGQVIKEAFDDDTGALKVAAVNSLLPSDFDSIDLSYTGANITQAIYKRDGLTVMTLDLTYVADKLTNVVMTRS